jgi:hypothetical protein
MPQSSGTVAGTGRSSGRDGSSADHRVGPAPAQRYVAGAQQDGQAGEAVGAGVQARVPRVASALTGTAPRNAAGSVPRTAAAYRVKGACSLESWLRHRGRPTLAGGGRFKLLVNSLATGAWRSALVPSSRPCVLDAAPPLRSDAVAVSEASDEIGGIAQAGPGRHNAKRQIGLA